MIKDVIGSFYNAQNISRPQISQDKTTTRAKYTISDEDEFARGRQVLGDLIVHGMVASGGTDID